MPRRERTIHPQHARGFANIAGNVRINGTHAGVNRLAALRQIFQAELQRVAAGHFRKLIDLRFSGKRNLRAAQAAIGTRRHGVRVHRETIDLHVGNAVGPDDPIGRLSAHHGAVFRVRAGIQVNRRLPRHKMALGIHGGLDANARVIPARGEEGFLHAQLQLHGPA